MTNFIKILILILTLTITTSCSRKDCSLISSSFKNYKNALQSIKSSNFKFSDNCNTSNSSWIYNAEYHSCDGNTGYLIIKTKSKDYIHKNVPINTWRQFKKAPSFGAYYNQYLKGKYRPTIS